MAETSLPHANAPATEPDWRKMARLWVGSGVDADVAGQLAPSADGTALETDVAAGRAWVDGFLYELDAATTVAHAAADPVNDRIDLVVLRLDPDGAGAGVGQVRLAVVAGVAAAAPARPALTQDPDGIWELELAEVLVNSASAVIAGADVTDSRVFADRLVDTSGTTAERDALAAVLGAAEAGLRWWDTDLDTEYRWNGVSFDLVAPPQYARIATGTYAGDATNGRVIAGVGFDPVYVMVTRVGGDPVGHITASGTLYIDSGGPQFRAFDTVVADGFEVSATIALNASGQTYRWVAFG